MFQATCRNTLHSMHWESREEKQSHPVVETIQYFVQLTVTVDDSNM